MATYWLSGAYDRYNRLCGELEKDFKPQDDKTANSSDNTLDGQLLNSDEMFRGKVSTSDSGIGMDKPNVKYCQDLGDMNFPEHSDDSDDMLERNLDIYRHKIKKLPAFESSQGYDEGEFHDDFNDVSFPAGEKLPPFPPPRKVPNGNAFNNIQAFQTDAFSASVSLGHEHY